MTTLTVTATLRSPAHLGMRNTSAYFVPSFRHVPGRVLLGAMAWAWIDSGKDPDNEHFSRLFLSGATSWGDLLPVPETADGRSVVVEMPLVAPSTLMACKLSGLRHSAVDSILRTAPLDSCAHKTEGRVCGAGLKRLDGVGAWVGETWLPSKAIRAQRTHLAIGIDTGTARPGYLYSREVLQEGQVFRGEVRCSDETAATTLAAEIQQLPLSIGSGRSRGYGKMEVAVEMAGRPSMSIEWIGRCADQLGTLARDELRDGVPEGARLFTLTAASSWALREPCGGYARTLRNERLAAALGVDAASVQIVAAHPRSETGSGWDGAAGLPTEVRHVVAAGSTFLCAVSGLDDRELCPRLDALLDRGIGGQRLDGFGRIILNHPLHFGGLS